MREYGKERSKKRIIINKDYYTSRHRLNVTWTYNINWQGSPSFDKR
jgi:hypothetical protein